MANEIKIGTFSVSAFKVGSSDCRVYLGDTLLYPHLQEPCFAVVDNISTYTARTYVDVFNEADGLWYKLNNLNQYEEYGVFGSGRTSCEGSTSRLPQGYTEVEYIENTSTAYINTDLQIYSSTTNSFEVESKLIAAKHDSQRYQNVFSCMSEDGEPYQGFTYRYQPSLAGASIPNGQNTFTIVNNEDLTQTVTVTSSSSQRTYTHTYPLTLFCGLNSSRNPFRWTNSKFYYCKIKMNDELVRDFVPCKRDSDDKYGMFDLVTNTFYLSPNNVDFSGGEPITPDCVTTYNGKLTIDGDYEYQYSGSSWNNVGEVSGSSRVPDGYTEVEYIENTSQAYINLGVSPYSANGNSFTVETTFSSYTQSNLTYLISCEYTNQPYNGFVARWNGSSIELVGNSVGVDTTAQNIPNGDGTSAITFHSDSTTTNNGNTPITLFSGLKRNSPWRYGKGRLYALKMTLNNSVVRELVPAKRDSDSKYGMYDLVTNTFYVSSNNYNFTGGSATGQIVYPMYYDEIQDPPNNLTFSSMTEAEAYECPWVGMHATINGDKYVFSGDSVSGYEWVYQPLPYDSEIQYLENSGTQYIDTNAYVNTSNFEIGYKTDGANTFFGYCHENAVNGTWFGAEEGNMFYGTYSDTINMSSYLTSGENTIVCTKSGVTVNNTSISKTLSLGSDNISNIPLLFFSRWDFYTNAPEFRSLSCRYKSFYLKNNGELVVDMIPVRVGQVGYMYDRVSGELFGNVGSGSFILGPDK